MTLDKMRRDVEASINKRMGSDGRIGYELGNEKHWRDGKCLVEEERELLVRGAGEGWKRCGDGEARDEERLERQGG